MIDLLFFTFLLVVSMELACFAIHKYRVSATRISTLPDTDHNMPKIYKVLIFSYGVGIALTLMSLILLGFGAWSLLITLLFYLAVRVIIIAFHDFVYAHRTRELRMLKALSGPKIASARFAFFFSGSHMQEPDHVTMWLEPLKSLNMPFLVVIQEEKHFSKIPLSEHYVTICLQRLPPRFPVLPPSVKTIFVANNSKQNLDMMKLYQSCNFIQLLHGDSDKPPSFNPFTRCYDYIFVAGQMGIDRYSANGVRIPPEKFRIVGRPQLTFENKAVSTEKTIVYMSTWTGFFTDTNFSSFSQASEIIRRAITDPSVGTLIFKPHPFSYRDPNWDNVQSAFDKVKAESGINIRWANRVENPFALYAEADLLISDISSTIIDYLYSGRPYIVTNPRGLLSNDLNNYPSVSGGYLSEPDLSNIDSLIALAFGEDPMAEKREEVRRYALGDLDLLPGEAFRKTCWDIIGEPDGKKMAQ